MQEMTLRLNDVEIDAIIKVLGNLPTSSNAWPLVAKISQQYVAQKPSKEESKEETQASA